MQAAAFVGPSCASIPPRERPRDRGHAAGQRAGHDFDEIYAGIDYQPLNPPLRSGASHFITVAELATQYLSYRDIVVLDTIPNDISVVSGIITEAFQTPLSHINVLSNNRKTPNMGLKAS
ncbi:MAG: hypothetical protein U1F43_25065 [Myxococcota bacterium]